jgi:hypothetical protein
MEPVSIIASIATAVKLIYQTSQKLKEIADAPDDVRNLASELSALHDALSSINAVLGNEELAKLSSGWSGNDVQQILFSLKRILDGCIVNVTRLDDILQKLNSTMGLGSSFLHKSFLAFKSKLSAEDISKYRSLIPGYQLSAQQCCSSIQM